MKGQVVEPIPVRHNRLRRTLKVVEQKDKNMICGTILAYLDRQIAAAEKKEDSLS